MAKKEPVNRRKKADKSLRAKSGKLKDLSSIDCQHLAQELAIHKIELEIKKEELRLAQIELKKYSERALHESEELYRSLFNNMINGFAYCRMLFEENQPKDFIYLAVNDAFSTLTGLKGVVGKRVTEVIPGIRQSHPKLFNIYGRVALTGIPERFETYVEALQQWFWISVYSPKKEHFVALFDVITDRKQVEEALRENKARLDLALNSAHMGVWHWDLKEKRGYFDDQVCHLLGIAPESFTGTAEEFLAVVHADDRDKIVVALKKPIEENVPYQSEYRVVWPDGSIHYITARGKLVRDTNGQPMRLNGICWDITERQQAEVALSELNDKLEQKVTQRTRFYALVAAVNEAIVRRRDRQELLGEVCRIMVEKGGFRLAWIGVLDMTSREVKQERSCGETSYLDGIRIIAADVPEGRGPTGRAVAEGHYVINADFEEDPDMLPWRERARAHGIHSSSAFPLSSEGCVIGALTIYSEKPSFFTDEEISLLLAITENISFALDAISAERRRLETEEALRRLNEELEQRVAKRTVDLEAANKELEAFSYSASHDLRAPLRHMTGFVELLQKELGDQLSDKTNNYMSVIAKASKKMGMLIDDLLTFSKVGRIAMQKRKVSLNNLVREVTREIKDDALGREIVWEIDELPDVSGDQSLLKQAIVNLISNAVKYTNTRSRAEITIGCKDEGSEIICSVKDNGVGFDMKYVDKLFGVFQRLHPDSEFEGTGIGLANVQRIISRHGGRTWAEGEVGQGATFYFALPKLK